METKNIEEQTKATETIKPTSKTRGNTNMTKPETKEPAAQDNETLWQLKRDVIITFDD
jgi:hypothetical protein